MKRDYPCDAKQLRNVEHLCMSILPEELEKLDTLSSKEAQKLIAELVDCALGLRYRFERVRARLTPVEGLF